MCQAARNLSEAEDGIPRAKKLHHMHRHTKVSEALQIILQHAAVEAMRLPPRPPNLYPTIGRSI